MTCVIVRCVLRGRACTPSICVWRWPPAVRPVPEIDGHVVVVLARREVEGEPRGGDGEHSEEQSPEQGRRPIPRARTEEHRNERCNERSASHSYDEPVLTPPDLTRPNLTPMPSHTWTLAATC